MAEKIFQSMIIFAIMASLAFFMYVFMIPAQLIRPEYVGYVYPQIIVPNITEAQEPAIVQEVVVIREYTTINIELGGIVRLLLIVATLVAVMVFAYKGYTYRVKKKAQELMQVEKILSTPLEQFSSVPQAEELAERYT